MSKQYPFVALRFIERLTRMPYRDLFGTWMLLVFAFAQMYLALSIRFPEHGVQGVIDTGTLLRQLGNSVYFSVATATTVGYGDLAPVGASRALAATEAMLGFAILAIFVSKIVSHKQEIALGNVHRLAFQNAFSAIREGFFILRRDCDGIISDAVDGTPLEDRSWENLLIVFQKGQILLESIPDFYEDGEMFTLDHRRELLLLESTHRTFLRIASMLRALDGKKISWRLRGETMRELNEFISLSDVILTQWQKHAEKKHNVWFNRIGEVLGELEEIAGNGAGA